MVGLFLVAHINGQPTNVPVISRLPETQSQSLQQVLPPLLPPPGQNECGNTTQIGEKIWDSIWTIFEGLKQQGKQYQQQEKDFKKKTPSHNISEFEIVIEVPRFRVTPISQPYTTAEAPLFAHQQRRPCAEKKIAGCLHDLLERSSLKNLDHCRSSYLLVMTNIAMENHHAIKNGKPSISMGHLYHGYVKNPIWGSGSLFLYLSKNKKKLHFGISGSFVHSFVHRFVHIFLSATAPEMLIRTLQDVINAVHQEIEVFQILVSEHGQRF